MGASAAGHVCAAAGTSLADLTLGGSLVALGYALASRQQKRAREGLQEKAKFYGGATAKKARKEEKAPEKTEASGPTPEGAPDSVAFRADYNAACRAAGDRGSPCGKENRAEVNAARSIAQEDACDSRQAAPGTQAFEGCGGRGGPETPEDAGEAVEASGNQIAKGSEAHAAAPSPPVPAAAAGAPSAGGADPQPDRKKRVVRTAAKQSGVRNVSWDAPREAWRVQWTERGRNHDKSFPVRQLLLKRGGLSQAAAGAEALREAVAFRESLAREGRLPEPRAWPPRSSCQGVSWHRRDKCWRVKLTRPGDDKPLRLNFRPKNDTPEEIEKARLAAVERVRELEREHVELRVREHVDRESGVGGVCWLRGACAWKSQIQINGVKIQKNFVAKDHSPGEIEAARLLAVQHRRGLERKKLEAKGAVGP